MKATFVPSVSNKPDINLSTERHQEHLFASDVALSLDSASSRLRVALRHLPELAGVEPTP